MKAAGCKGQGAEGWTVDVGYGMLQTGSRIEAGCTFTCRGLLRTLPTSAYAQVLQYRSSGGSLRRCRGFFEELLDFHVAYPCGTLIFVKSRLNPLE